MKVYELIEKLSEMPQLSEDHIYRPILAVSRRSSYKSVVPGFNSQLAY